MKQEELKKIIECVLREALEQRTEEKNLSSLKKMFEKNTKKWKVYEFDGEKLIVGTELYGVETKITFTLSANEPSTYVSIQKTNNFKVETTEPKAIFKAAIKDDWSSIY